MRAFEAAWARLQNEDPGWPDNPADQAFQAQLHEWLKFHGAMLVAVTLEYMQNNPMCPERSRFENVVVDEYQDLNRAEQALVDLLSEHAALSIIGDQDQSIYSFKHAHPEGITTFGDTHVGTHDETLDVCRRCPTCAASTTFAGRRQLFLPAKGWRMSPLATAAELGNCR